ncbi:MAG: biosynthetic arginine decarboxylase [Sumerlaeia bacterium]
MEKWKIQDSSELYGIGHWGAQYYTINAAGHVTVQPEKDPERQIDLKKLVDELQARGMQLPILVRFTDMTRHRLEDMKGAFDRAISENNYQNEYRCIYPIKVNQQRHVVEEYIRFGSPLGFGIEAGSKPELLAVLAMTSDAQMPIVCNGFKDDEFIELTVLARKMGKDITPIIEKFSELILLVKYAKLHNTRPQIGLRVKLSARGAGRWELSAGVRSKFGLTLPEILKAVEYLEEHDMLDCLRLLHFHAGSQITNIRTLKSMLTEAARVYVELVQLGAPMGVLDVGGGLGIDYDGSQTNFDSSMNYTLQEYANDVIFRVMSVCDTSEVPHPVILSESGRALVSYQSVLVFNVLGVSTFDSFPVDEHVDDETPEPLRDIVQISKVMAAKNVLEMYHDAVQMREECTNLFNLGYLDLRQRAQAEAAFWAICVKTLRILQEKDYPPEELEGLENLVSDIYFCNFSVFQSMPDSWAIKQLFPVMPIHRLEEKPLRKGVLADITCDSDGKIDKFVDLRDVKNQLELHSPRKGEPYLLGVFLIGAYQEILGDLHNLLGDTNTVHVSLDIDNQIVIEHVIEGDMVDEVVSFVGYDPQAMLAQTRQSVERALRGSKITLEESALFMRFFESGLRGYTYLE